jgi:hypothetical protein
MIGGMRESSFQSSWMQTFDYFAQELACLSSRAIPLACFQELFPAL